MASISVIIPTYNRGYVLAETLEQLLSQDYPAKELIVIDQTVRYPSEEEQSIASYRSHPKVKWLRQSEANASMARNRGAVAATGDVLLLLDDDVRIKPDFLQNLADEFADPDVNGVAGQVLEGEGKTTDDLRPANPVSAIGVFVFHKNYTKRCRTSWMISCNAAVRRDLYMELGGMDENYRRGAAREESDFAMRYFLAGHSFVFSPKVSVFHLGPAAPSGGTRGSYMRSRLPRWDHCIGNWYFILGFADRTTLIPLLTRFARSCLVNHKTIRRPWVLPPGLVILAAAFFPALWRRVSGPKLVNSTADQGSA